MGNGSERWNDVITIFTEKLFSTPRKDMQVLENFFIFLLGNHQMIRVLPHIYKANTKPVNRQLSSLIAQFDLCDDTEKTSLVKLLSIIANTQPSVSMI